MLGFLFAVLVSCISPAAAQHASGASPIDPFIINDAIINSQGVYAYTQTSGLAIRPQAFNSGQKNLVLIMAGQSNCTTLNPTLYTPTNSSVIDNFNIYDGASYPISGPVLGVQYTPGDGPGNVGARLADNFVTNSIFNRVILVPTCVAGSVAADWATGTLSGRLGVAMRRLAARGYTPGATGLTFAVSWWQGESDNLNGTSQSAYAASMATVLSTWQALCSGCRFFVNEETWVSGTTSAAIQAAQVALPNGTTVFAGGNTDSLNATNRQADNTHFNDTGAPAAATLVYNAMHASGSPF